MDELIVNTEDILLLEYAINTAIDHLKFLETLNVNLPELKPEANTIGKLIALRERLTAL